MANQAGYIYACPDRSIGVNNTSKGKYVYFDDMQIVHHNNNLAEPLQLDDYYPFGLQTADSWVADNTSPNNYLFNASSELNESTKNYQTFFRDYDPALGRMTGVDAMAGKYSSVTPYNYAFNDPVGLNDPSGADPYYLPRYQEDWSHGIVMDQGRIADPEAMAHDWVPGRGDLWGVNHISPGSQGDWANSIRSIGSNFSIMSLNQFNNHYGLNLDLRNSEDRDWLANLLAEPYNENKHGGIVKWEIRISLPVENGKLVTETTPKSVPLQELGEDLTSEIVEYLVGTVENGALKQMLDDFRPDKWLVDYDGTSLEKNKDGKTTGPIYGGYTTVTLRPSVFLISSKLYQVAGHELVHVAQYNTGQFGRWYDAYNKNLKIAKLFAEYHAYQWNVNHNGWYYRGKMKEAKDKLFQVYGIKVY